MSAERCCAIRGHSERQAPEDHALGQALLKVVVGARWRPPLGPTKWSAQRRNRWPAEVGTNAARAFSAERHLAALREEDNVDRQQSFKSILLTSAVTLIAAHSGCQEPHALIDDVVAVSQPIIHGKRSSASQNAVVMLRIADEAVCTGTLVAPNLVLTARHCVSETEEGIECAPNGRAISGGQVGRDRAPEEIIVYAGAQQSSLRAGARGLSIIHDGATNLCNHDIAFVVLDRAITGTPIASLRLTDSTRAGEQVTAVGWGLTSSNKLPKARMQRSDVSILDVGPSPDSASTQMLVAESICSGDSGGPALSAAGAIIGVVSYGGNGEYDPSRPAAGCLGARARNVYTRVAPFPKLIREAFAEAGATPIPESP
jgi:V8-like Glu-specific endopeptidase